MGLLSEKEQNSSQAIIGAGRLVSQRVGLRATPMVAGGVSALQVLSGSREKGSVMLICDIHSRCVRIATYK